MFASWGSTNIEATSEVVIALTALGIDPVSWNGHNMIRALCRYVQGDGSFKINDWDNDYTTCEACRALAAYLRFRRGMNSLYDMADGAPSKALNWKSSHHSEPETTQAVTSAQTADGGVAIYGLLLTVSLPGTVWVRKKCR